jgi:hypothetical protein
MTRQLWQQFYRLVTREVPGDLSRAGLYLVFGFIVAGFALLNDLPIKSVPSEAIGLLAAGAVVVAVRTEYLSRSEKIGWIVVAFFLFLVEMRIVTNDRAEQQAAFEEARYEESLSFKRALLDSELKFEATMKRSDAITQGLTEATELETGGKSYMCFAIGEPNLLRGVDGSHFARIGIRYDKPIDIMSASAIGGIVGKYPLHNVFVSVIGPLGRVADIDYGTIAPNELGRPREFAYLEFFPDKKRQYFHITINASNGNYYQNVLFLKLDGKWVWGSRLYKGGSAKGKLVRIWIGKGFPKNYSDADWFKGGNE